MYNLIPEGLRPELRARAARAALPMGAAVAVIEPFYKRGADGTLIVRVDNPAEVHAGAWKIMEGKRGHRGGRRGIGAACRLGGVM